MVAVLVIFNSRLASEPCNFSCSGVLAVLKAVLCCLSIIHAKLIASAYNLLLLASSDVSSTTIASSPCSPRALPAFLLYCAVSGGVTSCRERGSVRND